MLTGRDILLYLAYKTKSNWDEMYECIKNKTAIEEKEVLKIKESLNNEYITLIDEDFPCFFKKMSKPPFVLFYKGDISLVKNDNIKKVGFVGSRKNSNYGASATKSIISGLDKDVVIVNSGTNGQFSMDDYICTGFILKELTNLTSKVYLSDIAKASVSAYESYPDITSYIKDARHYEVMMNLNLQKDLKYCVQKNITKVVPQYIDGHIIGISQF